MKKPKNKFGNIGANVENCTFMSSPTVSMDANTKEVMIALAKAAEENAKAISATANLATVKGNCIGLSLKDVRA
jgi:hypothetical protein